MEKKWWHNQVVYQIYPRSFFDSNGDGIGDLEGITQKLDYLEKLGVGLVWLCPVYKSPNDDNGYDISDYYDIMDEFGTMEDMDRLLEECEKRNIGVMMDLVLNHSSDEHKWFLESKSSKESPYRDYYIWADPVNGKEPTDAGAFFGGSVWEYDETTEQYYLHSFSKKQPDLNWKNPKLRNSLYEMVNYWIDKGIKGFRLDAIDYISKDENYAKDLKTPRIHELLHELNRNTFGKAGLVSVGETGDATAESAAVYSAPEREELDMVFQFEIMGLDNARTGDWSEKSYTLSDIRDIMTKWQTNLNDKGWNSLFWDNHDYPRMISRYGDDRKQYREPCAKMMAALFYCMKGIPYIYQGEEIGMTNVKFDSINDYRDIETWNFYNRMKAEGMAEDEIMRRIHRCSRDNARTPMQWDDTIHGGFTTAVPWIKENENYKTINVKENLENPNSIFYFYQKLIQLRKEEEILVYGSYELLLPNHPQVYAYSRKWKGEEWRIICNFSDSSCWITDLTEGMEKVLGNYTGVFKENDQLILRAYETIIVKK